MLWLLKRTILRSTAGKVCGNKCESDCRSRGREFDPGLVPSFVEIDYEIISTVTLLPSSESFKKDCCQLQAKVCAGSTVYFWEHSGSVVECLTRDQGAAGLCLTGVTALWSLSKIHTFILA